MSRLLESEYVSLLNMALSSRDEPPVSSLADCSPALFIRFFRSLLEVRLRTLPEQGELDTLRAILHVLSNEILLIDLSHIEAERVVEGELSTKMDLIELIAELCNILRAHDVSAIEASPSPVVPRGNAPVAPNMSSDEQDLADLEAIYQDNRSIRATGPPTDDHSVHKNTRHRTPSSLERTIPDSLRTPPRTGSSKRSGASPTYKQNRTESSLASKVFAPHSLDVRLPRNRPVQPARSAGARNPNGSTSVHARTLKALQHQYAHDKLLFRALPQPRKGRLPERPESARPRSYSDVSDRERNTALRALAKSATAIAAPIDNATLALRELQHFEKTLRVSKEQLVAAMEARFRRYLDKLIAETISAERRDFFDMQQYIRDERAILSAERARQAAALAYDFETKMSLVHEEARERAAESGARAAADKELDRELARELRSMRAVRQQRLRELLRQEAEMHLHI